MNEQEHRESRTFLALGIIIVPVLFLSLYIYRLHLQKDFSAIAQTTESRQPSRSVVEKQVLESPLGRMGWHSNDANVLAKQIEGFFQNAYSGQTAAYGIKAAKAKYSRIIVIGLSHQVAMPDVLSVPRLTDYRTAMGEIPLDTEFINKLLQNPIFRDIPQAYESEHSVLIQLPLLQYRFSDFKLVPIVAGQCSPETIGKAAAILKSMVDSETLIIASSDFTHYGPNYNYIPFAQNVLAELRKLDIGAFDYISKIDSTGFQQYCEKTGATICGRIPIAIVLSMLPAGTKPELLKYTMSGELAGDYTNSVSYLSVAFHGGWQKPTAVASTKADEAMTPDDYKNLLALARGTIKFYLRNNQVPTPEDLKIPISEAMKVNRAAFVTLKKSGELRGCIGEIFPSQALYKSVIVNAINAAVNDRRFVPVQHDEVGAIKIEVSALTVPKQIDSYNQIRLGIDGIILRKEGHVALFLPQVAPEQKWTLAETLTQLSLKAGLPADGWKTGATFEVFQAEVFGEE
jgi:AmmeMemoRadiSam system protein B/AmmeMemoRadiSam system protein A